MTDTATTTTVTTERTGGLATITLNRPEALNAFNVEMKLGLRAALEAAASDPGVRAVLLTGSGRGFSVGQDLAEHVEGIRAGERINTVAEHFNPMVRLITTMAKPVVAAINGTAAGVGLSLALACDLRIGTAGAKYTTAFSAIGLTTDGGMSWTLPRLVGAAKAQELILMGKPFTSEQALEWGILNQLVAPEALLETAGSLAGQLAAGPTAAYALSKRALVAGSTSTLDEALDLEADLQAAAGVTADHLNAVNSFLAKEKPTFTGT